MDLYQDNGELLKRTLAGKSVPDYIKSALYLPDEKRASLTDDDFAYVGPEGRFLPTIDAGNTAISVIYFLEGDGVPKHAMQKVASRLLEACSRFGLQPPPQLVEASAQPPAIEKAATVIDPSREDIIKAAAVFQEQYPSYAPNVRRETARDIVKAASAKGVDLAELPRTVLHYAGDDWNMQLPAHLTIRKGILEKAGAEKMAAVIDVFLELALEPNVNPERFADELFEFDKAAGLLHLYDDRLVDAYASTFAYEPPQDTTNESLVAEALQKFASTDEAQAMFSDDVLAAIAEDPLTAIQDLPDVLRDRYISECERYYESRM